VSFLLGNGDKRRFRRSFRARGKRGRGDEEKRKRRELAWSGVRIGQILRAADDTLGKRGQKKKGVLI